jgi:flavin reductase (DIM6/NTAB) family NADH-FMN oxidoreductase RutF
VLWGRVTGELAAGDHDVFLVTVELVEVGTGADLVRRQRAYHGVGQALGDPEKGYPL